MRRKTALAKGSNFSIPFRQLKFHKSANQIIIKKKLQFFLTIKKLCVVFTSCLLKLIGGNFFIATYYHNGKNGEKGEADEADDVREMRASRWIVNEKQNKTTAGYWLPMISAISIGFNMKRVNIVRCCSRCFSPYCSTLFNSRKTFCLHSFCFNIPPSLTLSAKKRREGWNVRV